ncbi:hypothetical protein SS50377_24397 [Spironucleus salmonicida]|uniref:Uncharacterized protein n=1 Tax=Spironucleus salmonicida TaxID=348837 RepID=V6LP85_9EUKA|nr:hypothetical protein SS50377_24397 [Spironucleus salmonicida]|eukprot:EST46053.1 Hypothetical protein SS50377_14043 [Spironucleus salmonicida]
MNYQIYHGPDNFFLQNNIFSLGPQSCYNCGVQLTDLTILNNKFCCDKCGDNLTSIDLNNKSLNQIVFNALEYAKNQKPYKFSRDEAVLYVNRTNDYDKNQQLILESSVLYFQEIYQNDKYCIVKCNDDDFVISFIDLQRITPDVQCQFFTIQELQLMKFLPKFWTEKAVQVEFIDYVLKKFVKITAKLITILEIDQHAILVLQQDGQIYFVPFAEIYDVKHTELNLQLFGVSIQVQIQKIPVFLQEKYFYDIEQIQQSQILNEAIILEEKVLKSIVLNQIDFLQGQIQKLVHVDAKTIANYVHFLCIQFGVESAIESGEDIQRGNIGISIQRLIKTLS